MKRRAFCAAGVSAAALSFLPLPFLPLRRAFAADLPALTRDGEETVVRASDVEDLRAALRGRSAALTRTGRLRRGAPDLERRFRPQTGADRALRRRRGRHARDRLREGPRPARRGPRRRA